MNRDEVRRALVATGEEILDDQGVPVGYSAQRARFRLSQPYLAMGGFLVVDRDEATGQYIGTEFDALPHPKTGQPYPAGHSEVAWRVASLDEALKRVMAYFDDPGVQ